MGKANNGGSPRCGPVIDGLPGWLTKGSIVAAGLVPWSSNYTFLVTVRHRGVEYQAIYKPRRGESPLWDFPHGTLHRREFAAYLLSRKLGWPNVPPTVLRRGPLGIGSLQAYVEAVAEANYFTFGPQHVVEAQRIALFDCLVNNADRKAGHCLLDMSGKVWAIDHGLTFHSEPKLRSVIWEFSGQSVPADLMRDVQRIQMGLSQTGTLRGTFEHLLAREELEALEDRVRRLLDRGVYPHPGPQRSIPWPPV